MSLMEHAKRELENCGEIDYGDMMKKAVLEVLECLCNQGHTNNSASMVIALVNRLWKYKPLTPLTGEDDEWTDELDPQGKVWQNKRYSAVFKKKETGEAYDVDGIVFKEPDGVAFTCRESCVPVKFPYMPPDYPTVYKLKYDSDKVSVAEQIANGDYTIDK